MKYRWLHISDLHSVCKGIKTKIMRDELIGEINYINRQNKISFILITGDISDKNEGYDKAKKLIHRIVDEIGISLERVFIVPGNHDVDRNIPHDRNEKINKGWNMDILDEQEESFIKTLLPGQSDFFKAYEDILGRKYPYEEIHFFHELDENIGIVHLNTSWMCYDSNNESGKLHIGLNNVYRCLNDERLQAKPIKIVIGHHRLDDFNKTVKNHLKSLFNTKDIDLYLGGHCHDATVIYDTSIKVEVCSCRQVRAEDVYYPAGFIIGDINTESDQSCFQFLSWNVELAKWTYDYTVDFAKHGKYYLRGEKFTKVPAVNRNVIVDLKMMGIPLDYEEIMDQFNIQNSAIYSSSIREPKLKNQIELDACIKELSNIYNEIIKSSNKCIHIFPIALIPLLVSFGYLIQNNSSNIKIYQYYENEKKWVYDEYNDEIQIVKSFEDNNGSRLAVALNVSHDIKRDDIVDVLEKDFDIFKIGIEDPMLAKLNYYEDVLRVKLAVKQELDKLISKYKEIHLFLAAPAGLCIEIGRIIRENMYPDTFVYDYNYSNAPKYSKILNLKEIRSS